jgi:hypothetical protein
MADRDSPSDHLAHLAAGRAARVNPAPAKSRAQVRERTEGWDEADERLTVRFAFLVAGAALLTAIYQTATWAAG